MTLYWTCCYDFLNIDGISFQSACESLKKNSLKSLLIADWCANVWPLRYSKDSKWHIFGWESPKSSMKCFGCTRDLKHQSLSPDNIDRTNERYRIRLYTRGNAIFTWNTLNGFASRAATAQIEASHYLKKNCWNLKSLILLYASNETSLRSRCEKKIEKPAQKGDIPLLTVHSGCEGSQLITKTKINAKQWFEESFG